MKTCPNCHHLVEETDFVCSSCGEVLPSEAAVIQTSLFDQPEPKIDETRSNQEYRVKTHSKLSSNFVRSIQQFFQYFASKIVSPTDPSKRRRSIPSSVGYITYSAAAFLLAIIGTRLVAVGYEQYNWLASISILPGLSSTPNYWILFAKLVVVCLAFYFGFPILLYMEKKIILHRQRVFHYWMTEYAGMNAFAFALLLFIAFLTFVAPVSLFAVILCLLGIHILSFIVTYTAVFYRNMNDIHIDNIYLALIGLVIQLFLLLSVIAVLF